MKNPVSLLLFILLFLLNLPVNSQYPEYNDDEESRKGKFFITPEFGLQFGTITKVELAPLFGYYLSHRFSVGLGGRYEYFRDSRSYSYNYEMETNIYGIRGFARFIIIDNIDNIVPLGMNTAVFAHAELEGLNLERKYFDAPLYPDNGRFWFTTALIGGGILQQAGPHSALSLMVLWDVDSSSRSPYINPIFRMGFQFIF
jgi:hypothetical protein